MLKLRLTVEDVLEVQPGIGGYKDATHAGSVLKVPNTVVARTVATSRSVVRIIADDGGDFSHLKFEVSHTAILPSRQRGASEKSCRTHSNRYSTAAIVVISMCFITDSSNLLITSDLIFQCFLGHTFGHTFSAFTPKTPKT